MSNLIDNLQSIYQTKLQIKEVIETESDVFSEYPQLIEEAIEGGGEHPSGYAYVTANGDWDIRAYEMVNVEVPVPPGYIVPEGSYNIVENGTFDVNDYENAVVNVPASAVVSGTKEVTENGDYDVTTYQSVTVVVEGQTEYPYKDIVENGHVNVASYGFAYVAVPIDWAEVEADGYTYVQNVTYNMNSAVTLTEQGTLLGLVKAPGYEAVELHYGLENLVNPNSYSITANGTFDVLTYGTANVQVPASAVVSGTYNATSNGVHDITNYAAVDVNVPSSGQTIAQKNAAWQTKWAPALSTMAAGLYAKDPSYGEPQITSPSGWCVQTALDGNAAMSELIALDCLWIEIFGYGSNLHEQYVQIFTQMGLTLDSDGNLVSTDDDKILPFDVDEAIVTNITGVLGLGCLGGKKISSLNGGIENAKWNYYGTVFNGTGFDYAYIGQFDYVVNQFAMLSQMHDDGVTFINDIPAVDQNTLHNYLIDFQLDGTVIPSGTIYVTNNGTYDIASHAYVNVAVQGGDEYAWVDPLSYTMVVGEKYAFNGKLSANAQTQITSQFVETYPALAPYLNWYVYSISGSNNGNIWSKTSIIETPGDIPGHGVIAKGTWSEPITGNPMFIADELEAAKYAGGNGTLSITSNGTASVDQYSYVNVAVPSSGGTSYEFIRYSELIDIGGGPGGSDIWVGPADETYVEAIDILAYDAFGFGSPVITQQIADALGGYGYTKLKAVLEEHLGEYMYGHGNQSNGFAIIITTVDPTTIFGSSYTSSSKTTALVRGQIYDYGTGNPGTMFMPTVIATEVEDNSTPIPSGTIIIDSNGQFDVTSYGDAVVNVPNKVRTDILGVFSSSYINNLNNIELYLEPEYYSDPEMSQEAYTYWTVEIPLRGDYDKSSQPLLVDKFIVNYMPDQSGVNHEFQNPYRLHLKSDCFSPHDSDIAELPWKIDQVWDPNNQGSSLIAIVPDTYQAVAQDSDFNTMEVVVDMSTSAVDIVPSSVVILVKKYTMGADTGKWHVKITVDGTIVQ